MASSQHLTHLLNRCASGDRRAFEILYRETSAQLLGLATGIVKDPDLAGQILEESYVRIWEQAGHFQADKMSPVTWMTAIVRHQAIDLIRDPSGHRLFSPAVRISQTQFCMTASVMQVKFNVKP